MSHKERKPLFGNEGVLVFAAWSIFVIQGFFYSTIFPSWEGFDEPVHLGYIALLHDVKRFPFYGQDVLPEEIFKSIISMPVPKSLMPSRKESYGHWQKTDREILEEQNSSKYRPLLYQAHHPLLYYVLMLVPYRLFESQSLLARLYVTRYCSVLLASLFIFPAFLSIREITQSKKTQALILFVSVSFPGVYIDIARVGNDSLGLLLFTLLFYQVIRLQRDFSRRNSILAGLLLGFGLLTKTYFLAGVIPIGILATIKFLTKKEQRVYIVKNCVLLLMAATVLAMPWYVRNYRLYGIFFVTHERILLSHVPIMLKLQKASELPWGHEFGVMFRSFVWVGGWSFLDLPRAVYDIFKYLFMIHVWAA